jgi:hypothetical protein
MRQCSGSDASGSARQCMRQCAAVRQCGSVRQCGNVRQCAAVLCMCGCARGSVRQCGLCAAVMRVSDLTLLYLEGLFGDIAPRNGLTFDPAGHLFQE